MGISLLLMNYLLFVGLKWMADVDRLFYIRWSGIRLLLLVWLVEMVIVGLTAANNFYRHTIVLYKRNIYLKESSVEAQYQALQSQLNPHFLFNALESIRMRSLLKEENETADMVEKLAIMQRQYVDWGNDSVEIEQELEFVKAYLSLQKYRFGDRLNYNLEIDPECAQIRIPKLTIVTFVENACVHGIESKASPGWIFVRAYKREEQLYIEIEDTGSGIEEQKLYQMQHDMQNADIEMLKNKKSVGMLNACLRLKMYTEDHVCFEIEGEEGVGTWITICIPMEYLSFAEGCVNGPVCKRGKEIC